MNVGDLVYLDELNLLGIVFEISMPESQHKVHIFWSGSEQGHPGHAKWDYDVALENLQVIQ